MSAHTPGPWVVTTGVRLWQTEIGRRLEHGIDPIGCVYGNPDGDDTKANTSLIVAAPELLEFAEVAGTLIGWAKDNGAYTAASALEAMRRAAIAKATSPRNDSLP